MRAAVTTAKQTIDFQERADPVPTPGRAVVGIRHVTLCGTDLHIWENDYATDLPIIQGHEIAGVIDDLAEADARVSGLRVGDRVAVSPMFSCGHCYACRSGRVNACRQMSVYGCYEDGGLVTSMAIPLEKLEPVPDSLPLKIASLCEPVSIAMQAVNRGRPVAGEKVLVLGCGAIGLFATLYLTELGADVIAADTDPERCAFARDFGAKDALVVDTSADFPSAAQQNALRAWAGEDGPSLVLEATGAPASLQNAIGVVATAGRVVLVGISDREAALSMRIVPIKELDIIGSRNSKNLIGQALALVDRHQDVIGRLITHRFAFDDLDAAFRLMQSHTERVGKVAIDLPVPRS